MERRSQVSATQIEFAHAEAHSALQALPKSPSKARPPAIGSSGRNGRAAGDSLVSDQNDLVQGTRCGGIKHSPIERPVSDNADDHSGPLLGLMDPDRIAQLNIVQHVLENRSSHPAGTTIPARASSNGDLWDTFEGRGFFMTVP
jgi:hypothetical protein